MLEKQPHGSSDALSSNPQLSGITTIEGRCRVFRQNAARFSEGLAFSLVTRPDKTTIGAITTRRIVYWLAAMVVLLVVGTIIGLVWADASDVAGAFAGVTNIVSGVGIVVLLIALAVKRRRRPS